MLYVLDFSCSLDTNDFLDGFSNMETFADPVPTQPLGVPTLNSSEISELIGMNPQGRNCCRIFVCKLVRQTLSWCSNVTNVVLPKYS
jgi:hypothetical protein